MTNKSNESVKLSILKIFATFNFFLDHNNKFNGCIKKLGFHLCLSIYWLNSQLIIFQE